MKINENVPLLRHCAPLGTFGSGLGNLTRNLMAKFLSGYMLFCGTPAVWLRLPLQDKHNNSDGHTITMEDSFLSSHMSSTYSDCLLYTDVPVSVNTLFSLSFLYIYIWANKQHVQLCEKFLVVVTKRET